MWRHIYCIFFFGQTFLMICICFKILVSKVSSPRMGYAASGGSWRMDLQLLELYDSVG